MTLDDSSARKGILFLLLNAPKPAVPYYYTANELTGLLKRGGVMVSLENIANSTKTRDGIVVLSESKSESRL